MLRAYLIDGQISTWIFWSNSQSAASCLRLRRVGINHLVLRSSPSVALCDCDVGEIAGGAQRRLRVRQWEIEIAREAVQVAGRRPQQCPRHVPSCLGLHATQTNSWEACEHPFLDLADDHGC
jgi:hypothetical protein